MTSLTNLRLVNSGETETTSAADHSLKLVVDVMEKGNRNDFPLTDMDLNYLSSGVTELCACFVQLQHLSIYRCAALVHWPEKEFQSLVSLRSLSIGYCTQLVGYAQAPAAEPSATSESSSQLLPRLESVLIHDCESMVEVFKLPASLRKMRINYCNKLKSVFSRRLRLGQSASSIVQGSSPIYSEVSSSSAVARAEHVLFPCLERIDIWTCDSLTGVLYLPPSVKNISLYRCNELKSVESHSRDMPSMLESLCIVGCKTLSSLPDGPQAYSSLRKLEINNCPGMKRLPTSLQQRLNSLEMKNLDARYQEPSLFKPKTWMNCIRRD